MELSKSLKIETADKNIFVFQMSEVERIEKVKSPENKTESSEDLESGNTLNYVDLSGGILETQSYIGDIPKTDTNLTQGKVRYNYESTPRIKENEHYLGSVNIGYANHQSKNQSSVIKVDMINSYKFNDYFSLGVGAGIRQLVDYTGALFPIYADFKISAVQENSSYPFVSFGTGYSIASDEYITNGGLFIKPTLGWNFKIKQSNCLIVAIEYESQKVEVSNKHKTNSTLETLGFIIGITF